jgi:hypothetical protein
MAARGHDSSKLISDQFHLSAMTLTCLGLYNHQLIGVAFMVERECAEEGPFGSICADDMVSPAIK